ncbi:hypothetical protein T10_3988 [Trichinella papuae]|uniref:Uncharacterized protein n=1 Tax=Trichinella papuae TaxID=268474 RepID=A0A0V1M1X5_9BILA|nr:hypothetical protein T10_3988 [Trichinella papuae]
MCMSIIEDSTVFSISAFLYLLVQHIAVLPLKQCSYELQYVKWENVTLEDRPTNVHDSLALCPEDN